MFSRRQFLPPRSASPLSPSPAPRSSRAQTPPSGASVDPTLFDYLSLSPTSIANLTQATPLMAGNQQLQADTLDIALPFDLTNDDQTHEWIVGMFNVTLPSFMMTNVFRDDFFLNTGFDITQIESGAEAGEPPKMVTFLRGAFDPVAVQAVQLLNGYKQLEIAGRPVYSALRGQRGRPHQSHLSHGAGAHEQLDVPGRRHPRLCIDAGADRTGAYSGNHAGRTARDHAGVEHPRYPADFQRGAWVPATFLPGIPAELFQPSSQDEIAEAMEALRQQEPAPVVLAAIAGDSPGGPIEFKTRDAVSIASQPVSYSKFALAYATPEAAQTAATQIEDRLATGSSMAINEPWSSLFSEWSAVPNLEQSSVLLSLKWDGRASRAVNLVFNRDLGFITG